MYIYDISTLRVKGDNLQLRWCLVALKRYVIAPTELDHKVEFVKFNL